MTTVPTAQQVPIPSALDSINIDDPFVERVCDKEWRKNLAAGLPPSMFFSISGFAKLGDQMIKVEFNGGELIKATNEAGQRLRFPTAVPDRNGFMEAVQPHRQKEHGANIKTAVVNGEEVPVLDERGMPILHNETVVLTGAWTMLHIVKSRVNTDRSKYFRLHNVEIKRSLDPNTKQPISYEVRKTGVVYPCYQITLRGSSSYEIVSTARDTSKDVIEDGPISATADWRARSAARRDARATPATVVQAPANPAAESAVDAQIEAALAAAGRQF